MLAALDSIMDFFRASPDEYKLGSILAGGNEES